MNNFWFAHVFSPINWEETLVMRCNSRYSQGCSALSEYPSRDETSGSVPRGCHFGITLMHHKIGIGANQCLFFLSNSFKRSFVRCFHIHKLSSFSISFNPVTAGCLRLRSSRYRPVAAIITWFAICSHALILTLR